MKEIVRTCAVCILLALSCCLLTQVVLPQPAEKSVVLKAMEEELQRSMKGLSDKGNPPPYFISYHITESIRLLIAASYGAIRVSSDNHSRVLDVEVRVGDYQFDNTHRLRDRFGYIPPYRGFAFIPTENDRDSIKSALWFETDKKYKEAVQRLIQVEANKAVKVEEEDESADFSREAPEQFIGPLSDIRVDVPQWEKRLKEYSAMFIPFPDILESQVTLNAEVTNKYFVNSEGSVIQQGNTQWNLSMLARTKAADGMDLFQYKSFDSHSLEGLADKKTVQSTIQQMAKDLLALREAPVIEPYSGPAILSGQAAGVFFHEIFGHRIEGHRQKDESEGQTFTKKINQLVLPDFISVYDDPTIKKNGRTDLMGFYLYDDEGMKAQRVTVVERGVLKNFLMSRSPILGFDKSNGHGRKSAGYRPVARQGNLIVEASKTVSTEKLRELLIKECKKQGKPFGLIFEDISGGFTSTRRGGTQAYAVDPIMVYRVYADRRPDELVRGADLIGTPLISFSKILACADTVGVFNGGCGAESGWVPVSCVSPGILTGEIEIQKKQKSEERPPVLPRPRRRLK
ncbi:MAG: metallopeptidase TldD-related protein [Candidatus Aminicenantes bacterium]|jgi:predicted Zn-dependent protease